MEAAAKVHETHGERDSQRLFRKHNMVLNVPVSTLKVGRVDEDTQPVDCPVLRISSYFQLLLQRHPKLLFAGLHESSDRQQLLQSLP